MTQPAQTRSHHSPHRDHQRGHYRKPEPPPTPRHRRSIRDHRLGRCAPSPVIVPACSGPARAVGSAVARDDRAALHGLGSGAAHAAPEYRSITGGRAPLPGASFCAPDARSVTGGHLPSPAVRQVFSSEHLPGRGGACRDARRRPARRRESRLDQSRCPAAATPQLSGASGETPDSCGVTGDNNFSPGERARTGQHRPPEASPPLPGAALSAVSAVGGASC